MYTTCLFIFNKQILDIIFFFIFWFFYLKIKFYDFLHNFLIINEILKFKKKKKKINFYDVAFEKKKKT
jgi:hypothetical protein